MNKNDKKLDEEISEDDETVVTGDTLPGTEEEIDSEKQNTDGEGSQKEISQSEELAEVDDRDSKQNIDWEEKYKRALADYQNLEKRTQEYRREWIVSSNRELLLRILPVLDTLMLAKKHSDDKSLEVTVQQFINILKSEGITKIETEGQDFNPHLMEAVATDEGEEGKVLEEIQTGYMMNDKLLRPALVKVGKGKN